MKIKFTGYMDIAPEDEPDDRGSVDIWVLHFMSESLKNETDEAYEAMKLSWEVVDD